MVDAGVVAFHVAAEDELVRRHPGADVTHGGLGPALRLAVFARYVITAFGEIESAVQNHRQSLQHQGVQSCPQLNKLAFRGLDSPQRLEAILAVKQIVLELGFKFRPAAADIPDIGAVGVIDAALAKPGERGIQGCAGSDFADPIRRSSCICAHHVHDDSGGVCAFGP